MTMREDWVLEPLSVKDESMDTTEEACEIFNLYTITYFSLNQDEMIF